MVRDKYFGVGLIWLERLEFRNGFHGIQVSWKIVQVDLTVSLAYRTKKLLIGWAKYVIIWKLTVLSHTRR